MSRATLVLVHGRTQEGKEPEALKLTWLDALCLGLGRERSKIFDSVDIVFPFYGDMLDGFVQDMEGSIPADIVVRRDPAGIDDDYRQFRADMIEETRASLRITDSQAEMFLPDDVRTRGALNWEWVQALLRAAETRAAPSAIDGSGEDPWTVHTTAKPATTCSQCRARPNFAPPWSRVTETLRLG